MDRATRQSDRAPVWEALEANQADLEMYVSAKLSSVGSFSEPAWVADALDDAWPLVIAEAAAAVC